MPHTLEQMPDDAIVVRQSVRAADSRVRIDKYVATVEEPGTFARMAEAQDIHPPCAAAVTNRP